MRRRTLLASAGAGAMLTASGLPAAPAEAAVKPVVRTYAVQGTDLAVSLLPGPAATVLLYAARRFHYEIDALRPGDLVTDASGTVLDIRPGWYPAGARDGFLPYQKIVIHDIVAQCDGMLAWGGDARTPREGRFAIAVQPADRRLRVLAKRLDTDAASPSRRVGAGTALPFTTDRVRRAQSVRRSMAR
ncbi:hypothetical protein BJY16_003812 [Actinoplanes octamycinicus]|uniref:Uncharacterized protein n=1 Tax=Actinoplanes octamycinicus TaxID=135948 RepID=A0A7W7GY05_9ACTN|nr:hypothetical protein [Actinoplanes octamycinicus]MBB4740353.1 hypothetical protein [Actinoplanes octamycinicus]GIE62572.1 hypothetical protein Aoc01nite_79740 [Actinoplanes octamycinicus]